MGGWACLVSSQSPLLSPSSYLKEPQVFFNYFPHSMDGMILLFCQFFFIIIMVILLIIFKLWEPALTSNGYKPLIEVTKMRDFPVVTACGRKDSPLSLCLSHSPPRVFDLNQLAVFLSFCASPSGIPCLGQHRVIPIIMKSR